MSTPLTREMPTAPWITARVWHDSVMRLVRRYGERKITTSHFKRSMRGMWEIAYEHRPTGWARDLPPIGEPLPTWRPTWADLTPPCHRPREAARFA